MKDFIMRSLRAVFDFFITKPAQGALEVAEGVGAIVPELVRAATDAVTAQLSWAAKIKIVQGIDKVRTGAGKMLPALCAMFVVWALTPAAWPLVLYLAVVFCILDLPAPATSQEDGAVKVVG